MIRAVVGPDGSGKTTWLNQKKVNPIHANKYSRWLPIPKNLPAAIMREFIIGLERMIIYAKIRLVNPEWLDRCVIDSLVYAKMSGEKFNSVIVLKIAERMNFNAVYPDIIYQMKADTFKPKRHYTYDELKHICRLYTQALIDEGYTIHDVKPYIFGEVIEWKKDIR